MTGQDSSPGVLNLKVTHKCKPNREHSDTQLDLLQFCTSHGRGEPFMSLAPSVSALPHLAPATKRSLRHLGSTQYPFER